MSTLGRRLPIMGANVVVDRSRCSTVALCAHCGYRTVTADPGRARAHVWRHIAAEHHGKPRRIARTMLARS